MTSIHSPGFFTIPIAVLALTACASSVSPPDPSDDALAPLGESAQAIETCDHLTETYSFESTTSFVDVKLDGVVIARFTEGAYTVTVKGPTRSFGTTDTDDVAVNVTHDTYVRTLASPFSTSMSPTDKTNWVRAARQANCEGDKDILAIADEYTENKSNIWLASGVRIAGDADYGSGCDFHDYLCASWTPPDGSTRAADLACQVSGVCPVSPSATDYGMMDCSGFVRIAYSYRNNFEAMLSTYTAKIEPSVFRYALSPSTVPTHLPRDSRNQYLYGPGYKVVPFRVASAPTSTELGKLEPGDLLFFNMDNTSDGCCDPLPNPPDEDDTCCDAGITHVGIYMGQQPRSGKPTRYRVVNSRASINGPTMSDASFINTSSTSGMSARFRAARRL